MAEEQTEGLLASEESSGQEEPAQPRAVAKTTSLPTWTDNRVAADSQSRSAAAARTASMPNRRFDSSSGSRSYTSHESRSVLDVDTPGLNSFKFDCGLPG